MRIIKSFNHLRFTYYSVGNIMREKLLDRWDISLKRERERKKHVWSTVELHYWKISAHLSLIRTTSLIKNIYAVHVAYFSLKLLKILIPRLIIIPINMLLRNEKGLYYFQCWLALLVLRKHMYVHFLLQILKSRKTILVTSYVA